MATFFEFTAYGTDLATHSTFTPSTIHPAMPWTSPPPTSTPPTVHHHPGHQHDQPHYQFPSPAYPTLTPGPPDQSSWSTLTPVSTATCSPTPPTFPITLPIQTKFRHFHINFLQRCQRPTASKNLLFPLECQLLPPTLDLRFLFHAKLYHPLGRPHIVQFLILMLPVTTSTCPCHSSTGTDTISSRTQTHGRESRTEGSHGKTFRKTSPSCSPTNGSTSYGCTSSNSNNCFSTRTHSLGNHCQGTCWICSPHSTTTTTTTETDHHRISTSPTTTTTTTTDHHRISTPPITTTTTTTTETATAAATATATATSPSSSHYHRTSPSPTTSAPAAKARPTEPQAPASTTTTSKTAPPIRISSKSPMTGTSAHRPRRSRSRRRVPHRPQRPSPHRRQTRPRSPLPRQRSTTQNPKSRRTPSPHRRRSPPRCTDPPRRHRTPDPPRRSRTPSRNPIVLTPASRQLNPSFIPTPDADESWGNWEDTQPIPAWCSPTSISSWSSSTDTSIWACGCCELQNRQRRLRRLWPRTTFYYCNYEPNDIDVEEMKAAAADPERVLCVAELDPSHSVQLQTTLDHPTRLLFNNFIDEMFTQLAKPYLTEANETVYIKASRATVTNIAQCFAQARLLDVNLAKRTRADFVEPECLLTITVPTGLPPKDTKESSPGPTSAITKPAGNQLPKYWRKTVSDQPAGQRTTHVTGSSDTLARLQTRMTWSSGRSGSAHPTSTRLARDKTLRGSWQRAGAQNWSRPNREETTKSNVFVLSKALLRAKMVQRPWTPSAHRSPTWHPPTRSSRSWSPRLLFPTVALRLQLPAILLNLQHPIRLLHQTLRLPLLTQLPLQTRQPTIEPEYPMIAVLIQAPLNLTTGLPSGILLFLEQKCPWSPWSFIYLPWGTLPGLSSWRILETPPLKPWCRTHILVTTTSRTCTFEPGWHRTAYFGVTMLLPSGTNTQRRLFRQNWPADAIFADISRSFSRSWFWVWSDASICWQQWLGLSLLWCSKKLVTGYNFSYTKSFENYEVKQISTILSHVYNLEK